MFVNFPVKRHGVQTRQNKKRFSDIGERFDALVNFSEGEPKRVGLEPSFPGSTPIAVRPRQPICGRRIGQWRGRR